jgi:hypothetical protein
MDRARDERNKRPRVQLLGEIEQRFKEYGMWTITTTNIIMHANLTQPSWASRLGSDSY